MAVTDLATNLVVLNSFSKTLTPTTFGAATSAYTGVYARVSGSDLLDNIATAPVPEPASLGLRTLGGVALLARRRRA